jgi:L-seryl-tRNA(Ser) seleniumtransferase
VVETSSTVGGGSLPEETQPSRGIAIAPAVGTPAAVGARLRRSRPAVIGRILDGRIALDLRAILPEDDERLAQSVISALAR